MNDRKYNSSNKTYRIGIDARLWNETGVGRYIRNLVTRLQKLDTVNQYILFVLPQNISVVQSSIINSKWSIVSANAPWHTIKEQLLFPTVLEKEKLDLVHFPYFSVPILYKRKYILTIHDLILHQFPTGKASTRSRFIYWMKHVAYTYIIAKAAKHAKKIITVSFVTKKEIGDRLHVYSEKVVVTYEGVDKGISNIKYSRLPDGQEISNIKYPYFLYVGNAYPHKNLEILIKAFSQMVRNKEQMKEKTRLIFIGKKDFFYKRLEKKVKEIGLENEIIFKHNVEDKELSFYYSHALALVAPSIVEGFGLPLLEAMDHECLIVASDIPVFHEIGKDIPLYFSPYDINELRNVLESIAKGRIKDAAERKSKGKIHAKKFSWEKMAQQTLQIYQSCLSL